MKNYRNYSIYFKNTTDTAQLFKTSIRERGYIIKSTGEKFIEPGELALLDPGIEMWIPDGLEAEVRIARKLHFKGLAIPGKIMKLTENTRETLKIELYNRSRESICIEKEEVIAKIFFIKLKTDRKRIILERVYKEPAEGLLTVSPQETQRTVKEKKSQRTVKEKESITRPARSKARKKALRRQLKVFNDQARKETVEKLKKIYNLSKERVRLESEGVTYKPFNNLYGFLHNEYMLWLAYEKIKGNKGSLTEGVDGITLDGLTSVWIEETCQMLYEGEFEINPIKRIYVPKPGKKVKRPIGIPPIMLRIIQEVIRMILSVIYEPVFEKSNYNYGFRPSKSPQDAIERLRWGSNKGMTTAIEGDIKGAYDNVNQKVLLKILRKRIQDKKFLAFLEQMFRSGLIDMGKYQDTLLGVPQGGIASPILFNIYMHEFDEWITSYLTHKFRKINETEGRKTGPESSKKYKHINSRKAVLRKQKVRRKVKLERLITADPSQTDNIKNLRDEVNWISNRLNAYKSMSFRTPSMANIRKELKFVYVRYADDWVLINNASLELNRELKEEIRIWLATELKLTLSEEKTLVTDIIKGSTKFLGFGIKNMSRHDVVKRRTGDKVVKTRRSTLLKVSIDYARVEDRLKLRGYLSIKGKPKSNNMLIQQKVHTIIEKYGQVMRGLSNYYFNNITYKSEIAKAHYILRFSLAHTLANRLKISVRGVFLKYGKDLKANYEIETSENVKSSKSVSFPEYLRWMEMLSKASLRNRIFDEKLGRWTSQPPDIEETLFHQCEIEDFISVKVNLRTAFKIKKYCPLCGAENSSFNPIEMHHVKAVRKGKEVGFTKEVMRVLNKKQIPCCRNCHRKIHRGQYDGKKLTDFYDPQMLEL